MNDLGDQREYGVLSNQKRRKEGKKDKGKKEKRKTARERKEREEKKNCKLLIPVEKYI